MPLFDLTLLPFFPFVLFKHNKENQDPRRQKQFLMLIERSDVAAYSPSPHRLLTENCICAYLCMVGQLYRCSSVSFINLTAFFPPPKDNIYYKRKQYILARSKFVAHSRSS